MTAQAQGSAGEQGACEIRFIQYLRPDGRKSEIFIARPADIIADAERVAAAGLRFEAEILTTGEVSLTVFDPDEENTVAIEIVQNGPGVPAAVDRLVRAAASHQAKTNG